MASLFDRTKALEDIGEIYRRMTMNCANPSSTSERLWELRRATDMASHNPSDETMLEKAVVMLAANGHLHGWFNQCPTASGIGDPSRNRHSNVDSRALERADQACAPGRTEMAEQPSC